MYLWLDDVRTPPKLEGIDWYWAKTADEAIEWLRENGNECIAMSLDHDLGQEAYARANSGNFMTDRVNEPCGCDVTDYIIENKIWPREIVVHSWNTSDYCGGPGMIKKLRKALEADLLDETKYQDDCLITYIPFSYNDS